MPRHDALRSERPTGARDGIREARRPVSTTDDPGEPPASGRAGAGRRCVHELRQPLPAQLLPHADPRHARAERGRDRQQDRHALSAGRGGGRGPGLPDRRSEPAAGPVAQAWRTCSPWHRVASAISNTRYDTNLLLLALTHWLVYLQLIKMFLPKTVEDDWFLFLLGLTQVLVAWS